MSSLRTIPIDLASRQILQYLRTHNYDQCAIYINRLQGATFRKILSTDLSIDGLLAQLPFSIEVLQVIYSKVFIFNPDRFPLRILKPENFISKMISLFATTLSKNSTSSMINTYDVTMDEERLMNNLSSILRILSYVQPVLFKRLLHQRETIDRCILYFEQTHRSNSLTIHQITKENSSPSSSQTFEDNVRQELESTIVACQHALHRLENRSIPSLIPKSNRKQSPSSFDDIQTRLFHHQSVLNLIEPSLSRSKLSNVLDHLASDISIEKQILLAYSHIKTHEKQLPADEPLLPLFKRFAFAYERLIQVWRRVTDSLLIDECTDDVLLDQTAVKNHFERARSHEPRSTRHHYDSLDVQFSHDDMPMKTPARRPTPLQPLVLNGRNRQGTTIPPAGSLQSLTPLPVVSSSVPVSNATTNSIPLVNDDDDDDEKEKLKSDLQQLKVELQKSKELIARLQKSEEQMRERLAEQAQRQLEKGGKFEDLNQISRPTELIRSYNTLYSQSRIDALDALDTIREMSEAEDLKAKLLFSVVVLAFRHAQVHAKEIRTRIKQILQLSNDKSSTLLEETIEKYLRSTIQKYDVSKIAVEVENQLWITLYDYPALKTCNELLKYIHTACRTAWGLVNQTPPYYIEFQTMKYDKQLHERFHTSDNESEAIIEYIWPCLIDGRDRTCVAKGVVITDERYLSSAKN